MSSICPTSHFWLAYYVQMMMYAFGYNGFSQMTGLMLGEHDKIKGDIINLPCQFQLGRENSRHCITQTDKIAHEDELDQIQSHAQACSLPEPNQNRSSSFVSNISNPKGNVDDIETKPLWESTKIKSISLSWDSTLFIQEDGDWFVSGFHSSLEKCCRHIQSGCILWDSAVVIGSNGEIYMKYLNKDAKSWNRIHVTKEQLAIEYDDAKAIQHVVGGGKHMFAITDSQRVACLHSNNESEIILWPLNLHVAVKEVSCGKEHTLLLSRIGTTFSFGIGGQGQLGHGDIENVNSPKVIEALEGLSMVTVAAGGWHSVAVSDIGDVYIWGWNERGQLGFPSKAVKEEACEDNPKSCEVKDQHRSEKQFQSEMSSATEVVNILAQPGLLDMEENVDCDINVIKVSCGSRHTAAVTEDGHLYTWGWNKYGQLGLGDTPSRDKPTLVDYFRDHKMRVQNVVCGPWNTIVFTEGETSS